MIIESIIERNVKMIDDSKTALDAARLMKKHFIGSVIVTGQTGIRGLFTERDLMMRVTGEGLDPAHVALADVVDESFARTTPQQSAERCLELMKEHRSRHVLVFDDKDFVGLVSLRDMVALLLEEKEQLIEHLNRYIST